MEGGGRVSTISLLGCSTSVALATGPTDEEETCIDSIDSIVYYTPRLYGVAYCS